MSSYQRRPVMSLLTAIVLLSVLMSNYHVHGYRHSSALEMKDLRQLIRRMQLEDVDQQLFIQRRAEAEGDCTGDISVGYQWSGEVMMTMRGIDTTQRCMDNCDMNVKCMGWSYKAKSRMCWGLTAIDGIRKVSGITSGSCVGTNMKTKCTNSKAGFYASDYVEVPQSVASAANCMTACDDSTTCVVWYYNADESRCYLGSSVGTYSSVEDWLVTGSCLATQKRVRTAEPLKVFRQESLERHNLKRKAHCVPELKLDDDLNKAAQQLADQFAAADVTPPVYDISAMQTVYFGKGDAAEHGGVVVDNFYDEHKYYDYEKPNFGFTRHFPKIIWKSSKKMGVGRAFTSDKSTMFIVTKYDWKGDIVKSYKKNVQKKCG